MKIKNLRSDEVEIPNVGVVEAGGEIDVPDELAKGRKPKGRKLDNGEFDITDPEFDPGISGLLDQPDNWQAVTNKKTATAEED